MFLINYFSLSFVHCDVDMHETYWYLLHCNTYQSLLLPAICTFCLIFYYCLLNYSNAINAWQLSLFSWSSHYVLVFSQLLVMLFPVFANYLRCRPSFSSVRWSTEKFSSILRYSPVSSTPRIQSPFFFLIRWPCVLWEKVALEMFSPILSIMHLDLPLFPIWTIVTKSISPLHSILSTYICDLFYLLCWHVKFLGIWKGKCWHS